MKMLRLFQAVFISFLSGVISKDYYIISTSSELCRYDRSCLTVSELAANTSKCISSNTTLIFTTGTHYFNENLTVSDLNNLTITSNGSNAQIVCIQPSTINVYHSQFIHISNVNFLGCGGINVLNVEEFVLLNAIFDGLDKNEVSLRMTESRANITNCSFVHSIEGNISDYWSIYSIISGSVTIQELGLAYVLSDTHASVPVCRDGVVVVVSSHITFNQCTFKNNKVLSGGVLLILNSQVMIDHSIFVNNIGRGAGYHRTYCKYHYSSNNILKFNFGKVIYQQGGHVNISDSYFDKNSAYIGGVILSSQGSLHVTTSIFSRNTGVFGGVFSVLYDSNLFAFNNTFNNNSAIIRGGVLMIIYFTSNHSYTMFESCSFVSNYIHDARGQAKQSQGGVMSISESLSTVTIIIIVKNCHFAHNKATQGAVINSDESFTILVLETSSFDSNYATDQGGALFTEKSTIIMAKNCNFTHNTALQGSVIYAFRTSLTMDKSVFIANNVATKYATLYLDRCEVNITGNYEFSNNTGSLVAFNTNVSLTGDIKFINNQIYVENDTFKLQEGGAITLFLSVIHFGGSCSLSRNHAENGGAIHSSESKLHINGRLAVTHNSANENGGGIYLYNSEMGCQQRSSLRLLNNSAKNKGGGAHAISSSIRISASFHQYNDRGIITDSEVHFMQNTGLKGGGLSLELNSKLYSVLQDGDTSIEMCTAMQKSYLHTQLHFNQNLADYGAAIFVNDDTYTSTCSRYHKNECFFQVLGRTNICGNKKTIITKSLHYSFGVNYAKYSGPTLYGGLLDRCAISPFFELDHGFERSGLEYFKFVYNSTNVSTLSSDPVKVRHCLNSQRDCEHSRCFSLVKVRKGEVFTVSVVAVDQVGQPVSATIQSSLTHSESGLAEGQLLREIQDKCTELSFSITSTHSCEELILYASDGPCKDADSSKLTYNIQFLPCECPIGFQLSETSESNCTCDCHRDISRYVICDIHRESFVRKPHTSNVWISYENSTGYLVYLNCPYDYCKPLNSTSINLNQQNGSDAQCAFNRSSLLCGSCEPGLSLSLGSSLCLSCPIYWPALLISITIAAILAGIALVTLLLTLNMTVAVGTLNGLLLYVNILSANKSILLPFQEENYITVLISWLNLQLGIDTCYFEGMDTYTKTWIELAFPFYIMFVVVMVIIISSYSSNFSKVIGKKDPVATLTTLILFSYANLLRVVFRVFSFGTLSYADGTTKVVWLPDATISYLDGKHIALFLVAVFILVIGLVYTVLVLSWQWLLRLPDWKMFKWSRNSRLQTFIETYHTPYTAKHRYWTGLLLLVRVILYLVAAVNVSNSPQITLISIAVTIGVLLFLGFVGRVYKKWLLDLIESFYYFNILLLSLVTWYSLGDSKSNGVASAAAYISVTIALIVLFIIILFHVYFHTSLFAKLRDKKIIITLNNICLCSYPPNSSRTQSPPPDEDLHRFHELLDIIDSPANTNDYEQAGKQQSAKPTRSVVEISQPLLQSHLD